MKAIVFVATSLALAGCRSTPPPSHPPHVMGPDAGDHVWVFPESEDHIGSGGELQIYVDPKTHPHATASFAKYTLGVGGELPTHRHDRTEEFAYFLSGEGAAVFVDEDGQRTEIPVATGYVWYNPPGRWHALRNTGTTPLVLVFAIVPNEKQGLLSFFRRIGTTPGKEGTPIAFDELMRLGAEHDMVLREPDGE